MNLIPYSIRKRPWVAKVLTFGGGLWWIMDKIDGLDFLLHPPPWVVAAAKNLWTFLGGWGPLLLIVVGLALWVSEWRRSRRVRSAPEPPVGGTDERAARLHRLWDQYPRACRFLLFRLMDGPTRLRWTTGGLAEMLQKGFVVQLESFDGGIEAIYELHPEVVSVIEEKRQEEAELRRKR